MTELDSPETHIYIYTRGYRECLKLDLYDKNNLQIN